MAHTARRTAREIKRATPVYLMGAEVRFSANDDEPEPRHTRPDCCACSVCGGHRAPLGAPLCEACRNLALAWAGTGGGAAIQKATAEPH